MWQRHERGEPPDHIQIHDVVDGSFTREPSLSARITKPLLGRDPNTDDAEPEIDKSVIESSCQALLALATPAVAAAAALVDMPGVPQLDGLQALLHTNANTTNIANNNSRVHGALPPMLFTNCMPPVGLAQLPQQLPFLNGALPVRVLSFRVC
jgi:hypothetical protein